MAGATQSSRTSLAVWDIPTTAVAGERFTIKAGAKSSAGHALRGETIEACDASGAVVGSGELGAAPWPGTEALHWTELLLLAPKNEGVALLSVRFEAAALTPPHLATAATFAVMVVPPPEHTLRIRILSKEAATPLSDAEIRLGAHRATTDASGCVELHVAKGPYDLQIWKAGYDAPPRSLDVDGDAVVEVAAAKLPEENVDRAWRG